MDKERQLLRNLCFVLGAKFVEKLTRKVTHLLCKFATGEKYMLACKWGLPTITCEWLYECARKVRRSCLPVFCLMHSLLSNLLEVLGLSKTCEMPFWAFMLYRVGLFHQIAFVQKFLMVLTRQRAMWASALHRPGYLWIILHSMQVSPQMWGGKRPNILVKDWDYQMKSLDLIKILRPIWVLLLLTFVTMVKKMVILFLMLLLLLRTCWSKQARYPVVIQNASQVIL